MAVKRFHCAAICGEVLKLTAVHVCINLRGKIEFLFPDIRCVTTLDSLWFYHTAGLYGCETNHVSLLLVFIFICLPLQCD
jgi:hypothetical protein